MEFPTGSTMPGLISKFNNTRKKSVSFSIPHDDHEKASNNDQFHSMSKSDNKNKAKYETCTEPTRTFLQNYVSPSSQRFVNPKSSEKLNQSFDEDMEKILDSPRFEHGYLKFTHCQKPKDYLKKDREPFATRAKRLYILMDELKIAHNFYNTLNATTARDKFLVEELLTRHIMALDLALTEGYLGLALELTHTLHDTTRFMLPLFLHIFYNKDGSNVDLPFGCDEKSNNLAKYVPKVSPIISTLNKISGDRPRNDNKFLCPETLLTKLQLEMIALTICPIRSIMFRTILEIIPETAKSAYDVLQRRPNKAIRWINNSRLRMDYASILQQLGLADNFGCVGVSSPFISKAKRSSSSDECLRHDAEFLTRYGKNLNYLWES